MPGPDPTFDAVTLRDPRSALSATFVPGAGMVGTSLLDDGAELLGQRRGLDAYVADHKTMGIPLLYPWANRLSGNRYEVDGATITLTPGSGGVRADQHGVPIHGTLAGFGGWTVTDRSDSTLRAELDFGAHPGLLASFPFPHLLALDISLADRVLTIRTTVTPTTGVDVPLCFGFHPYLRLPDVPRGQWRVETPAMRFRPVNAWGIPTGVSEPHPAVAEPLADRFLDEGYDEVSRGAVFAVEGGGRRIEVRFDRGYPAAQVYAPGNDDVICFEPMAAPTDALTRADYPVARPREPGVAQFSIWVSPHR